MAIKSILLFLCALSSLQGHYVVVTEHDGKVDAIPKQDFIKLYREVLYKATNYIGMTMEEKSELKSLINAGGFAEIKFLDKKVKQINPRYHVLFVPTTLAELTSLPVTGASINIDGNAKEQPQGWSWPWLPEQTETQAILEDFKRAQDGALNYNKALARQPADNNKRIVDLFNSYKPQNLHEFEHTIRTKTDSVLSQFINLPARLLGKKPRVIKELADSVISEEYKALEENSKLQLRGTGGLESPYGASKKILDQPSTPLARRGFRTDFHRSFGNSLFAGIINDKGACAAHYFLSSDLTGYSIAVPIKELISNDPVFYYAALDPVLAVGGRGEFWHSRTFSRDPDAQKTAYFHSIIAKTLKIYTINGSIAWKKILTFTMTPRERLLKEAHAAEARFSTLPTGIGIYAHNEASRGGIHHYRPEFLQNLHLKHPGPLTNFFQAKLGTLTLRTPLPDRSLLTPMTTYRKAIAPFYKKTIDELGKDVAVVRSLEGASL